MLLYNKLNCKLKKKIINKIHHKVNFIDSIVLKSQFTNGEQ